MSVIPFDQRDGVIWFDGKLVPWKDAKVHVLTHGLHYGSCVFEGERAYDGVIYKGTEHSKRFHASAEIMDFTIPWSVAETRRRQGALPEGKRSEGRLYPSRWPGAARR